MFATYSKFILSIHADVTYLSNRPISHMCDAWDTNYSPTSHICDVCFLLLNKLSPPVSVIDRLFYYCISGYRNVCVTWSESGVFCSGSDCFCLERVCKPVIFVMLNHTVHLWSLLSVVSIVVNFIVCCWVMDDEWRLRKVRKMSVAIWLKWD